MNVRPKPILRFFIATTRLWVIALLASLLFGQGRGGDRQGRVGLIEDWTSRHLVFTNSDSPAVLAAVQKDPRFWMQWVRRAAAASSSDNGRGRPQRIQGDWAVSLGSGRLEPGAFPAKFTFDVNATPSCANDFVVFGLNISSRVGTMDGNANLVAFNNLYSGTMPTTGLCGSGDPTVMWAYRTSTSSGPILTSPALSFFPTGDVPSGGMVAFVESNGSTNAVFHILKWIAGQGTAVTSPANPNCRYTPSGLTAGSDAGCEPSWTRCLGDTGRSCLFSLTYGSSGGDSFSSPFVDYTNNVAYVGNDNGRLWKIEGVFTTAGTPALATSGGWAASGLVNGAEPAGSGKYITGPILDFVDNKLWFLTEETDLRFVNLAASPVTLSTALPVSDSDATTEDAPIVDGTNHTVFAFSSDAKIDGNSFSVAVQATASSTSTITELARAAIGKAVGGKKIRSGALDNTYFTTPSSGFLYVCGRDPDASDEQPWLYRFGFSGSPPTMSTSASGAPLQLSTDSNAVCSPISELKNGTTDRIFLGVTAGGGSPSLCTGGGCVMSIVIGPTMPVEAQVTSAAEAGGTSGIVVDNVSSLPQASSIYYTRQGNNTAVKRTQSNLQ